MNRPNPLYFYAGLLRSALSSCAVPTPSVSNRPATSTVWGGRDERGDGGDDLTQDASCLARCADVAHRAWGGDCRVARRRRYRRGDAQSGWPLVGGPAVRGFGRHRRTSLAR